MSGASLPTFNGWDYGYYVYVLIPDEWGKSSDGSGAFYHDEVFES